MDLGTPPETADERLATLSLTRLSDDELERIHLQLFFESQVYPADPRGTVAYRALSMLVARLARERKEAADPLREVWAARELIRLRQRVAFLYASVVQRDDRDLAWLVQAYQCLLGRGIHPRELKQWTERLWRGRLDREEAASELRRVAEAERRALEAPRDVTACWIMGTSKTIGPKEWQERTRALGSGGALQSRVPRISPALDCATANALRQREPDPSRCLISIITSVFKGGQFIDAFMRNVCSQSIFRDHCELIVVDAASPEGEGEVVARWMAKHPNIRYIRTPKRIGIYEAWNLAVREARGDFITNANVDDLRRQDSLEVQAATLKALPDVDVVYQDFYYSLEPCQSFERVAAYDFCSRVPHVTPAVLLSFNPPHNAPMWRRQLHDEIGMFDAHYQSAGDYEFWLRCLISGKSFYRIPDPHVAYYQNPQGCSTKADTAGHRETQRITADYAAQLLTGGRGTKR